MYYCYKLDKDKAMALQKIINKQIDLEHYDFYLDCHLSVWNADAVFRSCREQSLKQQERDWLYALSD